MRTNIILWASALAIAVAIDLPIALNRKHHVSHKASLHVAAAVVVIILLTVVLRGIFYLIQRVSGRPGSAAA